MRIFQYTRQLINRANTMFPSHISYENFKWAGCWNIDSFCECDYIYEPTTHTLWRTPDYYEDYPKVVNPINWTSRQRQVIMSITCPD